MLQNVILNEGPVTCEVVRNPNITVQVIQRLFYPVSTSTSSNCQTKVRKPAKIAGCGAIIC